MVATAPAVNTPVQHIVLEHVSWETYESLLADYVDQSVPHFTYDRGKLEIVSPLTNHEADNRTLGTVVELITMNWRLDIRDVGSMTYWRKDKRRGFEPDSSFYIQHVSDVRGKEQIGLSVDPPPDLVIEIEVTNAAIAKLPLYADAGIPEVWRVAGDRVTILTLQGGEYHDVRESLALFPLDRDTLSQFLTSGRTLPRPEWGDLVLDWARQHVPTRQR
jgi:Uma2 family endonuclease